MLILALETVTRRGSVALCVGDACHARVGDETPTLVERLPAMLTDWMAAHGRAIADLDLVAVVSGPGSFTGMRVGLATVQGLALVSGRRVVGVPTLDAMIEAWWHGTASTNVVVIACLDGQRGDVFVAIVDAAGAESADGCQRLMDASVMTPDQLVEAIGPASGLAMAGRQIVMVGDGAVRYADTFARGLPDAVIVNPRMSLAEAAGRIAAAHPDRAVAPHALRPLYVRRPDAVLARERANLGLASPVRYTIRRAASTENLSGVERLQRQTFTNPWNAESIRWELENTDVARLYVMHAPDGTLVAYCACWMVFDELHINSLAVDTARRRQGLARDLLKHVLAEAIEAGATSATLEVRSSNAAARGLYEDMGFKVEGLRRKYYQEPMEDAVILWKRTLAGDLRSTK